MIFLVRHAKAGHRDQSVVDDTLRPLTRNGWAQAEALVDRLIAAGAGAPLLASPYVRCMQTLEPLAARLGTPVEADRRLAEAQPFEPLLELLGSVPDGAVLCSHGDMIPDALGALDRRGLILTSAPNWKKASVWVLQRNADGVITHAAAWPPPDV